MPTSIRSGSPFAKTVTGSGTPTQVGFPAATGWIRLLVTGAAMRVFFSAVDAAAGVGFVDLPIGVTELPVKVRNIWVTGAGGTLNICAALVA